MTEKQSEALIAHWLDHLLDESEDYRATQGSFFTGGPAALLVDTVEEIADDLQACDYRRIQLDAAKLIKAAGLPAMDQRGADFGRLCRRLLVAQQDYLRMEIERWNGKDSPIERPTATALNGATAPVTPPGIVKPKTFKGPLFSVAVEQFFKENSRAGHWSDKARSEFLKFLEVIGGDKPVDAITKADGRTYKAHLLNTRKLGLATILTHLSVLSGLLRWCERQGYIHDNAYSVKGLAPDKKAAKKFVNKRFALRVYSGFPVPISIIYRGQNSAGDGAVQELSRSGCRILGNDPVIAGETLSVQIVLPTFEQPLVIEQATVKWVKGLEFGLAFKQLQAREANRVEHLLDVLLDSGSGRDEGSLPAA